MAVPGRFAFLENNAQATAVGEVDAFAKPAGTAQTVEHAGNASGVLAKLRGLAFEPVYFFDDFDRKENFMFVEAEERIGIVKEDVGIKDVVFFHA